MSFAYDISNLAVLLVEDNEPTRHLLRAILRSFGLRGVVEAADGEEAFRHFQQQRFDLVITDQIMAPMSGLDLTRKIRREGEGEKAYIPVIMVTGYTEPERVLAARDIGVTELLAKPVSPKSVLERIVSIIKTERAFVDAPNYVGPDRRRFKNVEFDGAERRRSDDWVAVRERDELRKNRAAEAEDIVAKTAVL